jgi:valyl-tRNA synthetase
MAIPTTYDPTAARERWYAAWQDAHLFRSEPSTKAPYSILMPPPNVTGILHFGHVLNHTLQDLYIRWNRLQGAEARWFPGLDHAGIATQTVVEKQLKAEGTNRHELGREAFVGRVWEWKEKYGGIILEQLRMLGNSCDWDTTLFTMDESASRAVQDVFITLFDEGLIYRGKRIINWSPVAMSALSDEEVVFKEVKEQIYTLRYHLADGSGTLYVATVRPETIFADVAVAVHPKDERFAHLIGKHVVVPLAGRQVPIIADEYVDMAFGTGCLKVTPAHDPNDYEIGIRHGLPMPQCINTDATLNELAGAYAGMERFKARRTVVKDLEAQELLEKAEPYTHNVGYSERGDEPVEPYLSDQWFVRMEPLAGPALKAVQDGQIKFYPDHWTKTYEHWMGNIRDWCISRQLWWGHRIPVFYAPDGQYAAARTAAEASAKLGLPPDVPLEQDPDVLDTWFSSWLWPMTTTGWEYGERPTADGQRPLAYYLPTNLLVTGPDIIFFWVARMIMATLKFDGRIPFRDVYFTSIIRDGRGRKLSKSLGNSPDPLNVLNKYGTDAVRFTMIYLAPMGLDVRLDVDEATQDVPSMEIGRNFANKVWNACRFLQIKREEAGQGALAVAELTTADRWILSRYHTTLQAASEALASYRITEYAKLLYDFVWRDFCDWYVEIVKVRFAAAASDGLRRALLQHAFSIIEGTLKLLHPVMPFLTEELYQGLFSVQHSGFIGESGAPTFEQDLVDRDVEQRFTALQSVVEGLRRQRSEMGIPPGTRLPVHLSADVTLVDFLEEHRSVIESFGRCSELVIGSGLPKPPASIADVVRGVECFLVVEGAIDLDKERERLVKELQRLGGAIAGVEKKLGNEGFMRGASPEVVEAEKKKLADWTEAKTKIEKNLAEL